MSQSADTRRPRRTGVGQGGGPSHDRSTRVVKAAIASSGSVIRSTMS